MPNQPKPIFTKKEDLEALPPLYAQEHENDPLCHFLLINIISPHQHWLLIEKDTQSSICFCWAELFHDSGELGYCDLSEMEQLRPWGIIDIFRNFKPCKLSEAKKQAQKLISEYLEEGRT
jgi:hypothetical protein